MKGTTIIGIAVLGVVAVGALYVWQSTRTAAINTPGGLLNSPALIGGTSALAYGVGSGVGAAISGLGQSIGNLLAGGGSSSNDSGTSSTLDSSYA